LSGHQYAKNVDELLIRLTKAIQDGRFWVLCTREENQKTIDDLQYTIEDVNMEFMSLKRQHCDSGPDPDDNGTRGMFWKFHKIIHGKSVYMKVMESQYGKFYVGFSFHED